MIKYSIESLKPHHAAIQAAEQRLQAALAPLASLVPSNIAPDTPNGALEFLLGLDPVEYFKANPGARALFNEAMVEVRKALLSYKEVMDQFIQALDTLKDQPIVLH